MKQNRITVLRTHTHRVISGVIAMTIFLLCACSTEYRMGDVIKADPNATAQTPSVSNPKKNVELEPWNEKWRLIQSPANTIGWVDHFRVCGIKFRYRSYDELLRCLDLFEAKIAKGGKSISHLDIISQVTPVLTGWLRASVYAELGETELALKSADSAWLAMPEEYRNTRQSFWGGQARGNFTWVAEEIGGSGWIEDEARAGRDNPAGLDVSAETIAMSLAAQRSLLHQHLGHIAEAKSALAELIKWESIRGVDSFTGMIPSGYPYKAKAHLLAIGPLFAMGEYGQVVQAYDESLANSERKRHQEQVGNGLGWVFLFPFKLRDVIIDTVFFKPFSPSDARLFAVAVEDVSNALIYAESLLRTGKTKQAQSMLDTLLALPEIRAMGNLYWVALYERSRIELKDGKSDNAIRLLEQSIAAIESVRSSISFEAAKIGFAGDKQQVYAALVGALAQAGKWDAAFLIAERAKARALVDLLAQRRDLAPPPQVDDKVRELFAQASNDGVLGLPGTETALRGINVVAEARTSLAGVAPESASLVAVQQVPITAIAARLARDETLIDYYRAGDDLYALLLHGTTIKGIKLSAQGLDEEVRAFRDAIERRDASTEQRGRALYDRLIRPIASEIHGKQLTISPHGVLHYLPFAALSDGSEYLLDRYSIRLIPSAGTLVYLKTQQASKPGKVLALGNPDLGNPQYDLPGAQTEAIKVAALFPQSRALVRQDASKSAIKELGNGFAILHFAMHGKFDADQPLSSGLYMAKGKEADGVLTVGDLYTLRWDADLITLSACETGLGKVANGDDVIGLSRGFLYAGAGSIVASLWEVDDAATEQLMLSFYRNLSSHDKREALRLAQIKTRKSYPNPTFWAAFQIVGRAD